METEAATVSERLADARAVAMLAAARATRRVLGAIVRRSSDETCMYLEHAGLNTDELAGERS